MVFHPSVSMLTEMTHLTLSPGSPGLPTVFITRRMISSALSESENLYFGFLPVYVSQFPDVPAGLAGYGFTILHLAVNDDGAWVVPYLLLSLSLVVAEEGVTAPLAMCLNITLAFLTEFMTMAITGGSVLPSSLHSFTVST